MEPSETISLSQSESALQQLYSDLKRRIVADLELSVNTNFHEELIMHIMIDHTRTDDSVIIVGVFLAKGCNFCRKKGMTAGFLPSME